MRHAGVGAESGDYSSIHNIEHSASLLNIGVDSLVQNDNWY